MENYDVVIVGAGLAGLTAAYELSKKGHKVVLLEAEKVIGGRTASWNEDGMKVESGLHRFLGFYKQLPALLEEVGVNLDEILCWEDEVEIRLPDGGPSGIFGTSPVYNPIRTIGGFLGETDILPLEDKAALVGFFTTGLKDYATNPEVLDEVDILTYAKRFGLSDDIITRFIEPLSSGLFFLPMQEYSAYVFFMPLATALPRIAQQRLGAFMGGMTEVMCTPIARAIEKNGGEVQVMSKVEKLLVEDGKVIGVLVDNDKIHAKQTIIATELVPAQKLIKDAFGNHEWFADMLALESMPAVTIQIELDQPAMDKDRTTFGPGTSMASFSEQSRTTFQQSKGRLSVIMTPPDEFIQKKPEELLKKVVADAKRLGIELEGHVKDYRVVNHPYDFYRLSPGNEKLKPPQKTPVPGLTLAGDYTKQIMLSTMEGAVISGQNAAEAVDEYLS